MLGWWDCPSVTKFEGVRIFHAFSGALVFVSARRRVSSSLQKTQADRWLGRALAESHHLPSPPDALTCGALPALTPFFPTVSMSLLVFMVLVFYLQSNIMLQVKKIKKSKPQNPGS